MLPFLDSKTMVSAIVSKRIGNDGLEMAVEPEADLSHPEKEPTMSQNSLPMAYAVKRQMSAKKKMAEGGEVLKEDTKDDAPNLDSKKAQEFSEGASGSGYYGGPSQWVKNIREGLKMSKGGKVEAEDDSLSQDSDESMHEMDDMMEGDDDILSSGDSDVMQEESDHDSIDKKKARLAAIMSKRR